MEILIDAGTHEAVESLDRLRQPVDIDTHFCGQLRDGVRHHDRAGFQPLARDSLSTL